jgi:hypothetical protein
LFEFLEATGCGVEWLAAHCRVRGLDEVFAHYERGRYPPWRDDVAAGYHRPAALRLTADRWDRRLRPEAADARRIAALAAKFEAFTARFEAMRPACHRGLRHAGRKRYCPEGRNALGFSARLRRQDPPCPRCTRKSSKPSRRWSAPD